MGVLYLKLSGQLDVIFFSVLLDLDRLIVDQVMSKITVGRDYMLLSIQEDICRTDIVGFCSSIQ